VASRLVDEHPPEDVAADSKLSSRSCLRRGDRLASMVPDSNRPSPRHQRECCARQLRETVLNTVFMRCFVLVVCLVGPAGRGRSAGTEQAEDLARIIEDVTRTPLERQGALARLETRSPERAVEEAEKVIRKGDGLLRTRAAWILADSGRQEGIAVLQQIASIPTNDEDVIAIEALGRLRIAGAHPLLRSLLEEELARSLARPAMPSRVSALVRALADYRDATDTALLATAVDRWLGRDSWPYVEALGITSGPEAIPILLKAFRASSRGITMVTAGLALARCGWQPGEDFVRSRIDALQADAGPLDPDTRRESEWILDQLGTPQDESFVSPLLRLVEEPAPTDRSKAFALTALLRINPTSKRDRVIAVAWKNTNYISAARLIALDDEAAAREALAQRESGTPTLHAVLDVYLMRASLAASPRDRRQWREIHGYTF
jgi:HEAT repeat protein